MSTFSLLLLFPNLSRLLWFVLAADTRAIFLNCVLFLCCALAISPDFGGQVHFSTFPVRFPGNLEIP